MVTAPSIYLTNATLQPWADILDAAGKCTYSELIIVSSSLLHTSCSLNVGYSVADNIL